MTDQLALKEMALQNILSNYGRVAVAMSGGVDSSLLLDVAFETLGANALALTAHLASLPQRELLAAQEFCQERGIVHIVADINEFGVVGFAENPPNRCYHCKRAVLTKLLELAKAQDISVVVEGSNLDDIHDYRPGFAAITELGVASPLLSVGFTKDDIRALSKRRGLSTWDKPACACLATRIPFGVPLTPELLARIDKAEQFLLSVGAKQVRVRVHGNLARIEVDEDALQLFLNGKLRQHIDGHLRELGFAYVTLDVRGYQMGSMNESSAP